MDQILINPTASSPEIVLNIFRNELKITGTSRPNDASRLYQPVLDTIINNSGQFKKGVTCTFFFQHSLNVGSLKNIVQVLETLKNIVAILSDIKISWIYTEEDNDIKEIGELISSMLEIPFSLVCEMGQVEMNKRNMAFAS